MQNDYITKADAITALGVDADVVHHGETQSPRDKINAIPAADVAEVVHARWGADADGDYYRCNVCTEWQDRKTAYCPNCGAKMDGKWNADRPKEVEHHAD